MNMQETARLILGLRKKGWNDTEINDLMLFIESGNETYINNQKEKSEDKSEKH